MATAPNRKMTAEVKEQIADVIDRAAKFKKNAGNNFEQLAGYYQACLDTINKILEEGK